MNHYSGLVNRIVNQPHSLGATALQGSMRFAGTKLSRKRSLGGLLSLAMLLGSCAIAPDSPQTPVVQASEGLPDASSLRSQLKVQPAAVKPIPKTPGLVAATDPNVRVRGLLTGRTDPFASAGLSSPIMLLPQLNTTTPKRPTVRKTVPTVKATLPKRPTQPVIPPISLPPPPSPTAIADAVQITGAVQIEGQWVVVVKEPDSQLSRYVRTGDRIANGQVLIKEILGADSGDPTVLLEQNGITVTKPLNNAVSTNR